MKPRKQFTFYRSFYNAISQLPKDAQQGMLLAIIEYALDGILPEGLSSIQMAMFVLIQPTLDSSRRKAEAGMKGKPRKTNMKDP